jgi:5'(3')-deoxyribonucleotidase
LDVDETLAATTMDAIKKLHAMDKMKFIQNIEQVTSFDWTNFPECDISIEELNLFWQRHHLSDTLPIEGTIDSVFTLFNKNKNLHIITARNEHDHRSDTEKWMNLYFPEIHPSNIHFANHSAKNNQKKSTICKSIGVTLMIDDGLHNALDLAEYHIECILIDRPWNRSEEANHPLIHRVQTWQEIIDNLR